MLQMREETVAAAAAAAANGPAKVRWLALFVAALLNDVHLSKLAITKMKHLWLLLDNRRCC